jgi:hypothetical protein
MFLLYFLKETCGLDWEREKLLLNYTNSGFLINAIYVVVDGKSSSFYAQYWCIISLISEYWGLKM